MILWIIFILIIVSVLAAVLAPLLRRSEATLQGTEFDLAVYRDQLDELDRDIQRGVLSKEELEDARLEVSRRMLALNQLTTPNEPEQPTNPLRKHLLAMMLGLGVPMLATLLYMLLGNPTIPSEPFSERTRLAERTKNVGTETPAQTPQLEQSIKNLQTRLKTDPSDIQGWVLLGRSYLVTGSFGEAAESFERALQLAPLDGEIQSYLGEALVFEARGTVTEKARAAFQATFSADRNNPAARYYLALADAQAGKLRKALDAWLALASDTPGDAPWLPALRRRLETTAADLKIDLNKLIPKPEMKTLTSRENSIENPGPSLADMKAAAQMQPGDRAKMINSMVEGLAERLKNNPDDEQGWSRLARSYRVLGKISKAKEAELRLKKIQDKKSQSQKKKKLSDKSSDQDTPINTPLPSTEQMEIVRGMINRLATRLRDAPNDIKGWEKLAKSYRVLGENAKAIDAEKKIDALRALAKATRQPTETDLPDKDSNQSRTTVRRMIESLEIRLTRNPQDKEGWLLLAHSYSILGQSQKALKKHKRAAELWPADTEVLALYARALVRAQSPESGLSNKAFNLYRRVLEKDPVNTEALYFVALGEAQRTNPDEASLLWKRLLELLDPKSDTYKEVEKQLEKLVSSN